MTAIARGSHGTYTTHPVCAICRQKLNPATAPCDWKCLACFLKHRRETGESLLVFAIRQHRGLVR
jgi:hypothetical protein